MRNVEARIEIKATPARVIDAIVDFESLKGWWGVERVLIEKRVGGPYVLAWEISDSGVKYLFSGFVSPFEPSSHLQIDNFTYVSPITPERQILGPMSLRVEARAAKDITEVSVFQSGYKDGTAWNWYHNAVAKAWPEVLKDLKAYLER